MATEDLQFGRFNPGYILNLDPETQAQINAMVNGGTATSPPQSQHNMALSPTASAAQNQQAFGQFIQQALGGLSQIPEPYPIFSDQGGPVPTVSSLVSSMARGLGATEFANFVEGPPFPGNSQQPVAAGTENNEEAQSDFQLATDRLTQPRTTTIPGTSFPEMPSIEAPEYAAPDYAPIIEALGGFAPQADIDEGEYVQEGIMGSLASVAQNMNPYTPVGNMLFQIGTAMAAGAAQGRSDAREARREFGREQRAFELQMAGLEMDQAQALAQVEAQNAQARLDASRRNWENQIRMWELGQPQVQIGNDGTMVVSALDPSTGNRTVTRQAGADAVTTVWQDIVEANMQESVIADYFNNQLDPNDPYGSALTVGSAVLLGNPNEETWAPVFGPEWENIMEQVFVADLPDNPAAGAITGAAGEINEDAQARAMAQRMLQVFGQMPNDLQQRALINLGLAFNGSN